MLCIFFFTFPLSITVNGSLKCEPKRSNFVTLHMGYQPELSHTIMGRGLDPLGLSRFFCCSMQLFFKQSLSLYNEQPYANKHKKDKMLDVHYFLCLCQFSMMSHYLSNWYQMPHLLIMVWSLMEKFNYRPCSLKIKMIIATGIECVIKKPVL